MYINYLSNKTLFIDPHLFIYFIIHHFIMFETITYNNLKTLVHDLMTRLYDQYHQIWTWRIKIYHKDNKSKYNQLMKFMRTIIYKSKYKYNQLMKVMRTLKYKRKYKYDQLMKIMRTLKYKRKYKYDQLMKIMRTLKYKFNQLMKSWGQWNINGSINTIKKRYMCSFRSFSWILFFLTLFLMWSVF
jgi:DNA repair ATPase RecN